MESLESRVSYLEKLVRTQTDRIEMLADLVNGFDSFITQLQKNASDLNKGVYDPTYKTSECEDCDEFEEEESSSDPEHFLDFKPTCDFTDQRKIDDCGVEIDFGYGSNRDLEVYKFSNVSDEVGERILKFINEQFTNGKDISDFVQEHPLSMKEDIRMPTDETIAKAKNHDQSDNYNEE
jgi:hypothetical protein